MSSLIVQPMKERNIRPIFPAAFSGDPVLVMVKRHTDGGARVENLLLRLDPRDKNYDIILLGLRTIGRQPDVVPQVIDLPGDRFGVMVPGLSILGYRHQQVEAIPPSYPDC